MTKENSNADQLIAVILDGIEDVKGQNTNILDLKDIKLTKGHKSCIKNGKKYLEYEMITETKQFMKDYFEIAGKVTRPEKTFELLEEFIELGFGMLLKAKYDGKTVGYIYILIHNDYAYYFMSATYPQYKRYNVSHYLQSIAFEILKEKGVKKYELGHQPQNSLVHQPTEKEFNISKFKRNFGGQIIVDSKSEYFFNKEEFEQVYTERIENYCKAEYE